MQLTTEMPTDAVTRTAFGYVAVCSGTVTFSDIAMRKTSSATQTVVVPDLNLEITQYINPITTSPPTRAIKRSLFKRGQSSIYICPVPQTITVIEWVDCVATPISCNVCHVLDPTSAEPECTTDPPPPCSADPPPPCSTSTLTCISTTKSCPTCPGRVEDIILAESDHNNYKAKQPYSVCPGGLRICDIRWLGLWHESILRHRIWRQERSSAVRWRQWAATTTTSNGRRWQGSCNRDSHCGRRIRIFRNIGC